MDKCKHQKLELLTEDDGFRKVAVCYVCKDCNAVLGMKPKDRRKANALLQMPKQSKSDE